MPADGGDDGSVVRRKRGWILESRSTYRSSSRYGGVCHADCVRKRSDLIFFLDGGAMRLCADQRSAIEQGSSSDEKRT